MKTHLRAVHDDSAQTLSPARVRLRDLLRSRDEAGRRIADLQTSNGRLAEFSKRRDECTAALAEFDRHASEKMLAWSGSPSGDAPNVDAAARGKLVAALTAAQENAAAADAAKVTINRDIGAAAAEQKALELPIALAISAIVAETAGGDMLDDLREAVAVAVGKQERLRQAVAATFTIAHAGPVGEMKPIFEIAERLDAELRKATAPAAPDGSGHHGDWLKFATALRSDAAAKFEG